MAFKNLAGTCLLCHYTQFSHTFQQTKLSILNTATHVLVFDASRWRAMTPPRRLHTLLECLLYPNRTALWTCLHCGGIRSGERSLRRCNDPHTSTRMRDGWYKASLWFSSIAKQTNTFYTTHTRIAYCTHTHTHTLMSHDTL